MKKQLSILIYSLAGGGAERVVSLLTYELQKKFDLTLVLMNDTIEYSLPENLEIEFLEHSDMHEKGILKLLKIPYLAYKYKKICQEKNIDISVSFMNRPNYINVIAKLFGLKVKTLISERAMPSLQYGYGDLQSKVNKFLIRTLYPKADKIIANSMGNTQDLIDNFFISKQAISVVYNPIDIEKINYAAKEEAEINTDKYTFVTIGRLDTGKNHKMLINAFSQLNNKEAQLYIIGDGYLRDTLQQQIDRLNLRGRVVLLGKKANPYKFLAQMDCFTFTSNHEGFPNVILEALACGLPIISTDCQSGPKEILAPRVENEFGILVNTNATKEMTDAMQLMMDDKDLSNLYQNKARIRARDFDKNKIIKNYIRIINE